MRVHVYDEELTNEFSFVEKHVPETGKTYYGFRIWLKSAPELHNTPQDDDRSAVTLWFGTKEAAAGYLRRAATAADGKHSYTFRAVTLPDDLKESLDAYAERGRPTGDFLRACLENNLSRAFGFGDEASLAALPAIVGYIYNEMPMKCWGSRGAVVEWMLEKQLERAEQRHT